MYIAIRNFFLRCALSSLNVCKWYFGTPCMYDKFFILFVINCIFAMKNKRMFCFNILIHFFEIAIISSKSIFLLLAFLLTLNCFPFNWLVRFKNGIKTKYGKIAFCTLKNPQASLYTLEGWQKQKPLSIDGNFEKTFIYWKCYTVLRTLLPFCKDWALRRIPFLNLTTQLEFFIRLLS